jgi:hypothetical protein
MKFTKLISTSVVIALCAVTLSGCGNDGTPAVAYVAGTDIPVTATETPAGLVSFANLSVAGGDDSAEPFVVGDAVLATSETDEPDPSV